MVSGTEKELASLESDAHKAELKWRTAKRRNEESAELALRERRLASSKFRAAKRRWEACWWDDLASKAQEAGGSGDSAAFWQICRQLGFRESLRRQTRGKRKKPGKFFHTGGEGMVADDVWRYVPMATEVDKGLQGTPSCTEFESALKSMKLG